MQVFWTRTRRDERRQVVLDQLIEMDFETRRRRLAEAVLARELKPDEVETALRLVERLDRVREMRVPLGGHLPGWENQPASPVSVAGDERREPVAIPVAAEADRDPVGTWLDTAEMPLDVVEAIKRPKRRRRRVAVPVSAEAAPAPASEVIAAQPEHDENWPSIAWLRPG